MFNLFNFKDVIMKLKLFNLITVSLLSTTACANQYTSNSIPEKSITIQTQLETHDLEPVSSASEPATPVSIPNYAVFPVVTPVLPVEKNSNAIQEKGNAQNLNSTEIDYDYLHSYDVPVYTQEDYERAKQFIERERDRQNISYPVYIPVYNR